MEHEDAAKAKACSFFCLFISEIYFITGILMIAFKGQHPTHKEFPYQ